MVRLALIALAGAIGTLARYGTAQAARALVGDAQVAGVGGGPLGTLVVNVVGCFVLSALAAVVAGGAKLSDDARLAIGVGFCGGLTTYSTFNQDALTLLRGDAAIGAVVYVLVTLVLCALTALLGLAVGAAAARALSS